MTASITLKIAAACALLAGATPAFSYVLLESKSALAGSGCKAVFLIGQGCQGSATTGVAVQIPAVLLEVNPAEAASHQH